MPVDDRVRVAPTLDIGRKSPDRGVDCVRGGLLIVEEADHAPPAGAVDVPRAPAALAPVPWDKKKRRWKAQYTDANGKTRQIGLFDTQEDAAHAVNAAIHRAGLEGRRHTNPVVDGRLVPRKLRASGHSPRYAGDKRRREASGAALAAPPRARPRRSVNDDDSEPDADED